MTKLSTLEQSKYPNSILVTDRRYNPIYLKGNQNAVLITDNDGNILWENVDNITTKTVYFGSDGKLNGGRRLTLDGYLIGGRRV